MSRQLRALIVLAEDPSLLPSIHTGWLCDSSFNSKPDIVSTEGIPRSDRPVRMGHNFESLLAWRARLAIGGTIP